MQFDNMNNTNPTKNEGELRCSYGVSSSFSISGSRRVALVNHEWWKDGIVITTKEIYLWSFMSDYNKGNISVVIYDTYIS
jgi:hypothetical protein